MRPAVARGVAVVSVLAAALVAYAVGNGDIQATPEVQIITITSTTSGGAATTTLQNTTTSTTYNVLIGGDASCDPMLMFSIVGGDPIAISPSTSRGVQLSCPVRGAAAMRRCLYHATNNANGAALADFMNVCLYGSTPGTLMAQQTTLAFGTVTVGDNAMLPLDITNNGTAQTITRLYLQTTDLAGNFQFSTPCNPDAPFCDQDISAVPAGTSLTVQVKCTPQSPGVHTAQLYVGTNTFQLLAQPVTLTCTGGPAATPVLAINPTGIDLQTPIEATDGSAHTVIHLANAGAGTLLINDVRTVDVDTGAATDWTYSASGECSGIITSQCSLDAGKQVDINLTFDPSALGRRRATLLISYRDTIDRTKEISLDGIGLGATLEIMGPSNVSLGQVPIGRTSTVDLELLNRGNRDLTAQLSLAANTSPPFTLTPATSALVTPNVLKTISATCAPSAAGVDITTVTAQAMDALTGSPATVTVSCEGTTSTLYANPTAINLGEIRIGAAPIQRTIQVLGTAGALTLTGQPQLENPNPAITLSPLSQLTTPATFDVTIDVAATAEGQLSASIALADTDGDTLKIPITATIVKASYEVAPDVDLGTFCVNQPTTSSNVSLASDGTATIKLMKPTLNTSPSSFQIEPTTPTAYPALLAAGTTATVSITPQRQSAVVQLADTLTWHTDVENMQAATTELTARFIDQGGAIAPPALDFGKVTVHLFSEDGQRVVIQNCNPTPLVLDPPMIRSPFRVDSPTFPSMLNPNESATFSVGFHPTRIGIVTDTLRITSPQLPNGPLEVTLVGEGVTNDTPPPDAGVGSNGLDHTSFYACSCKSTRPSGGLPIVIAVMCVVFPRRRAASLSARRRRPGIGLFRWR